MNFRNVQKLILSLTRRLYSTKETGYKLAVCELDDEHFHKVRRGDVRGMPLVHHHDFVSDLPPRHRFGMKKFHGVLKFLRRDQVISTKQIVQPYEVSESTVELVHTEEYVDKFFNGKTTAAEQRKTGFVWNEGLVRRCRLETGGTVLGSGLALDRGVACSTGGGTHHAFPDHGAGFCLINDLATAARRLVRSGRVGRVLIVDLDVHQGDGTAVIFAEDRDVFTFSLHCEDNFPLHKQKSHLDVGLPKHTGDADYQRALESRFPALLGSVRPDVVLYDAGVDPHVRDELGKLNLTDQGLYKRDHYVIDECVRSGVPVMCVIGGGYSSDINELSLRHTIVHRAATKVWQERGL